MVAEPTFGKSRVDVQRFLLQVLKGTTRYAGEAEAGPGEAAGYKEYTQTEVRTRMPHVAKKWEVSAVLSVILRAGLNFAAD
jgi:hypothetical protein